MREVDKAMLLNRIIKAIFGGSMLCCIFCVVLMGEKYNYCKSIFTGERLLFATCFMILIYLIVCKKINAKKQWNLVWFILINCIIFILQICIFLSIFFETGWDVWTIDYAARVLIDEYDYIDWLTIYYSKYPNNIILTVIYAINLKIAAVMGLNDVCNGVIINIALNCILAQVATYLVYYCLLKELGVLWAKVGWVMAVFFVSFSPWVLIPYSDSIAIIIPISLYALYISIDKRKRNIFFLGMISLLGYYLKPQSVIITIAIVICETITINRNNMKKYISFILIFLIGFSCAGIIKEKVFFEFEKKIDVNNDASFSLNHWVMMGLNDITQGRYLESDVVYSASFPTKEERSKAQKTKIKERLFDKNYDIVSFELNKLADCYSDGTFSWSTGTGDFYLKQYSDNRFSILLKKFFYYEGEYYGAFSSIRQVSWFSILVLCFFSILNGSQNNILLLTIVGVTLFELIFEVFPRHLLCNVPCFIVLSMYGLQNIIVRMKDVKIRKRF